MLEPRASKTIRPVPLPARASRLTESSRRLGTIGWLIYRIVYRFIVKTSLFVPPCLPPDGPIRRTAQNRTTGRATGRGNGAESDLWISCASRHVCGCVPPLHGILETVEKTESHTRLHHLNICVPPCLPTGETDKRNEIGSRHAYRQDRRCDILV